MMLPTREQAKLLLREAEKCNPGSWGDHSRTAAHCAERIARACRDLDPDKAYILGLLHDIGRRFGVRHLGHVSDGYSYMMSLGYDEAARICLTHSFHNQMLDDYIGRFDTSEEELELIRHTLASITMDDYDRLIQLCDSLAGAEGVLNMEERMEDVRKRYGSYPQEKWDRNLELRRYFEEKMGKDIYIVTEKETFRPYLDPLKEVLLDYDIFCRTAERLEPMDIKEQHEEYRDYSLGIQLDLLEFPADYRITDHMAEVYARSVLSNMAYCEEWDWKWDHMPQTERRRCLTEGRAMYEEYAAFREVRLISRSWADLAGEIASFGKKIPDSRQKLYLDRFENASVIELGGSYAGDATWWSFKDNTLLVVGCGIWD